MATFLHDFSSLVIQSFHAKLQFPLYFREAQKLRWWAGLVYVTTTAASKKKFVCSQIFFVLYMSSNLFETVGCQIPRLKRHAENHYLM